VYPKADVQRCVVHKVRNTLSRVRKKDQFRGSQADLSSAEQGDGVTNVSTV
jgi:transposase-like protein